MVTVADTLLIQRGRPTQQAVAVGKEEPVPSPRRTWMGHRSSPFRASARSLLVIDRRNDSPCCRAGAFPLLQINSLICCATNRASNLRNGSLGPRVSKSIICQMAGGSGNGLHELLRVAQPCCEEAKCCATKSAILQGKSKAANLPNPMRTNLRHRPAKGCCLPQVQKGCRL